MDNWITGILHVSLLFLGAGGQDVFNTMPPPINTNFSCRGRDTGFYADTMTNCRAYHTCDDHGNKFTYYCPAETAFRQEALVCDHAHLVDCANGHGTDIVNNNDEARQVNTDNREENDGTGSRPNRKSLSVDSARNTGGRSLDVSQSANSNPAYTRSFRITAEPASQFPTPKSASRKQPTFVLSSSVFLRNRGNNEKNMPATRNNRVVTEKPSRTEKVGMDSTAPNVRPFGGDFKINENSQNPPTSRSMNSDDKNYKRDRFFGGSTASASSTTTFDPFMTNNKVKSNSAEVSSMHSRGQLVSQFRHSNTDKESIDRLPLDRFPSSTSTTTFRPFGAGFKVNKDKKVQFIGEEINHRKMEGHSEDKRRIDHGAIFANDFGVQEFDKTTVKPKSSGNQRPSFYFDASNFPYSETLRSMQAGSSKAQQRSSSTAKPFVGTEFPVPAFTGSLSPLVPNELEDDPYYPKRSTTTEAYYKLSDRDDEGNRRFRFSTRRPWPESLDFVIPEVLPDLNTLDDLVDRRKLFYIPRVKAT